MLEQVNAHGFRGHFIISNGLKRPAIGGVDQQDDNHNAQRRNQKREDGIQLENGAAYLNFNVMEVGVFPQQVGTIGDRSGFR